MKSRSVYPPWRQVETLRFAVDALGLIHPRSFYLGSKELLFGSADISQWFRVW